MLNKLVTLLPILAVIGLVFESVPVSAAHGSNVQHRHRRHRDRVHAHVRNEDVPALNHARAARQLAKAIGAQERRRGSEAGRIIKRTDGTTCRVRGSSSLSLSSSSSPSPSSSLSSSTTTTSSTWAQTSTSSPAWTPSSSSTWVATYSSTNNWNNDAAAAAPSTTTTTYAASTTTASSSYSGGGSGGWLNTGSKFGLGWPNGNYAGPGQDNYIGNYVGSKASWYYTWSPDNCGYGDSLGLEFVPMLWGPNQVSDWWSAQSGWPSTVKNAFFFNEPNEVSQSNIAAGDAVSYWMNDYLPVKSKGISLGGAATTSAPSGLQWIQDFSSACTADGNSASDCAMAFVPIHWYDTDISNFQEYVQNFNQQTGLDIWVTEYACQNYNGGAQCTDSQTWALHQQMAAWFDEQDYVIRYAPFGVMENLQGVNQDNALMNPDGSITSLGTWYIYSS